MPMIHLERALRTGRPGRLAAAVSIVAVVCLAPAWAASSEPDQVAQAPAAAQERAVRLPDASECPLEGGRDVLDLRHDAGARRVPRRARIQRRDRDTPRDRCRPSLPTTIDRSPSRQPRCDPRLRGRPREALSYVRDRRRPGTLRSCSPGTAARRVVGARSDTAALGPLPALFRLSAVRRHAAGG